MKVMINWIDEILFNPSAVEGRERGKSLRVIAVPSVEMV
jgi:hypothetical protein